MKDWRKSIVSKDISIIKTLEVINNSAFGIALIVDNLNMPKLIGIVTDGDIRRAIIKNHNLSKPITTIMNKKPATAKINDSQESILALMQQKELSQIPVVDDEGNLVHLEVLANLLKSRRKDNLIFIMAGGLGTRLYPLTENCPKPMLLVGNKPILEIIIENFINQGFYKFCISVNYKADIIKQYFQDGRKLGIEIFYIEERERLGTAGALSLLKTKPFKPLIVINGDILANINFSHLIEQQNFSNADAIMCVRDHILQIPYGVVEVKNNKLCKIIEKPSHKFLVSAGIYILKPKVLDFIPKNTFYDMPKLFEQLIEKGYDTKIFTLKDNWLDIGQKHDYEQAQKHYTEMFK